MRAQLEREIIFIGTPSLCSPHHQHRLTVILVAAYAAHLVCVREHKITEDKCRGACIECEPNSYVCVSTCD